MTILPMLASPTTPASGRRGMCYEDLINTGQWIGCCKMDGIRALASWSGMGLTITNRVGTTINHRYPEIVAALTHVLIGVPAVVIDAEIIARNGRFETTLLRDAQENPRRIAAMAASLPCAFVAFDLPEFGVPWHERRRKLNELAKDWPAPTLATTVISTSPDFLVETRTRGMEGVIAKHVDSRYEFGKRSKQWLKFKNRYTVTCLVAGYAPGTGSRADFGAMQLALLDEDGTPVSVGRVGTGFTAAELIRLKHRLDAGELLAVEIETTNQTKTGQLRFPVYVGIRQDVSPLDCKLAQLQFLPTC